MLVATKKISLDSYSEIQGNSYSKGSYCFYVGEKGQSLEQVVDTMIPKSSQEQQMCWLFIFENYKEKSIHIVFAHKLIDTITLNLEDEAFSWEKFNSILKTVMITHRCDNVLALEGGKIYQDKKITVPLTAISEAQFTQAKKKTRSMAVPMVYAFRSITIIVILGLGIMGQSYVFDYLTQLNKKEYSADKDIITRKKKDIRLETQKLQEKINEYPTALAQSHQEVLMDFTNLGVKNNAQ